ncbi:DUF2958 domain-containing protein [Pandoraea apista]|uniref:defense against restriction DarA-related protein n=1 Tax=Pandoraea apista TaxID=93218 RepID=UPI000B8BFED4|nr:hypothetical protein [Pandoraea apista]OXS89431.1 hypothetical protein B7H01_19160 [Pandoraea apista]
MTSTPLHLIESAAHEGAFGQNLTPEPSAAQCRAGNYKMGRVGLHGLNLVIEQPRGSTRSGVDEATGKAWSSRMAAHYGYIGGTTGADGDGVDCFIGPYPDAERAYVINQNVGGQFDEHKVMLAFPDLASARSAYLNSYERGWNGLESIVPASLSQLKWWLTHGDLKRPLRADTLPKEGLETMKKTHWNTDALPYDTTLDKVLYDIRRSDSGEGLLLDAVTAQEIIDDAEGALAFDALVTPYAKLERRMELLRGIMERTGDKVKPIALQVTDPFKQRGVANVAAIFELSDGQTVTIFFHNPDVTPNKMAPADEVISWKWLLNKKDITIVVAPERGADLNIREVARRIMRLAEKNSEAFQRVNATRAARMQNIQTLKDEITTLETELATAQHELEVAKVAAEGKPEFDPTTPEGYAKVRGDEALQLYWQDRLDAFFQGRIVAVRNALRALGWEGREPNDTSFYKDGSEVKAAFSHIGAGRNVTGWNLSVLNDDGFALNTVSDDLTKTPEEYAAQVDAAAMAEVSRRAQAAKDAQQKPDITYRNSADGLFTSFFPNTPEGEKAWNIINATPGAEGGKVLAAHAEPTIAQLREAGYTVAEDASPATTPEEDEALLKELGGDEAAAEQAKKSAKWWEGSFGEKYAAVYLLGKSRGNDYLTLTEQSGAYLAHVKDGTLGRERVGAPAEIVEWLRSDVFVGMGDAFAGKSLTVDDVRAKLKLVKGEDILFDKAAGQQDDAQKLIDAYVQSFGAAAAVLNAAVAAVNWDGIIDTQTMRAELDKLGVASRTGQYDIIGKASQALEAGGIKTWDERLSSLREDPGFAAWSTALDAAASARDRIQSIAKERLIAKGTSEVAALTPETPLADVAAAVFHKAGIDTGSQTPQIVAAIEAKDAALAWSILSNLDNKSSAEIFERATGIKLAKTQRDRRPQIDEWAGITAEKRAELEAQRSEAQEAKRRDDNLKWAWNGLTSISVRTTEGTVSNGQDFVKSLFEQGFGEVVARKRGAATSYYVRKGDRITGLKSKNFNGFLKAALAFGGLRQALESLGVAEPQAEKTDAEKIAAVDEAYRFTSATDEFKLWLSESVLKGDYSPFVTAKGMDEAAKRHGAEIEWGEFAGAAMDSVHTVAGEQFDGGEFDTLRAMKKNPKIEDGDVPSKASRDSLVERGYVERGGGFNWLTNEGRDLVAALDDTGHAVAALQQALDVAKNNEPINRTEGNTEQADLEAEVAASIEEAIAILTEGDYEPDEAEVGATFDVETALDSAAGFEVETEVRAIAATKSLLNDFGTFLASDAKFAAALDSAREIATFDSAIVPLRSVMSFGASLSGVEMTTDETERMSTFARDARAISDRLTGRAAETPEKSPALDGVDDDGYVGKVKKGDQVLGRIDIGDDGKAMVYVGQAGDERVKGSEGRPFMYSEDDAPEMVEALFAAEESPAAQPDAFVGPAKDRMAALKVLTDTGMNRWMSEAQNKAVIAGLIGEEWQFFADKMKELAGVIAAMPKTYDQDGKGDEAVAHLHYFRGAGDWYITEKDMEGTGTEQAFGLADLYGDGGELGYISIYELTEAGVELDFHFKPKTIGQIRGKSAAEEQPQQTAAPDALPDTSPDVPELIAAGFSRVLNNDYVRSVQAGDKKLQFNIRVTEDGFVVRLAVGFSGGITGAAAEIGRTTDVGAAITIADAEAAKRGAGDGQADPQKDADRALFQSVIDGTVPDILAPDLADTLEAAFSRNQDDPALVTLFEQAVAAYQNAMLAATANLS